MTAKKILVVDDEQDILKIILSSLNKYGHDAQAFSDPVAALGHFQQNYASYALLLVDIRMPGMSGLEFIQHAQRIHPNAKMLLMTAFELNMHEIEQNVPFVKAVDLLKKPFMLSRLCQIIDKHLVVRK